MAKGVQVTAIIECAGVWFAGSKFGLTWRAKQIAIHKLPEKMSDFAFMGIGSVKIKDEVDDDEAFCSSVEQSKNTVHSTVQSVVDSVLPDEEDEEVEPVSVPKKMIIKKSQSNTARGRI